MVEQMQIKTSSAEQLNILDHLFAGDGEMCALMRSHDWSQTPLGDVEQWPQSLRTTVSILLNSRYPMFTFWGPNLVKLYNDGYRPVLGDKHPWALGRPGPEIWPEIWGDIGPMVEQVITEGKATWSDNLPLFMHRSGYLEETYFTFSYSPVRDETGGVGGMFCACTETTQQVLGERRLRTLRDLANCTREADTTEKAYQIAMQTLANNAADVPFALLYLLDAEGKLAELSGNTGLDSGTSASPVSVDLAVDLSHTDAQRPWPLMQVLQSGQTTTVTDVIDRVGALDVGIWDEPPHTVLVLPVASPGQASPTGLLVAGISPRRALDDDYQGFLELVAGQVASTIADVRAYEAERQRAEKLAEIDRAKTLFFSNVSHEFRTPLTLMIAPLEDLLSEGAASLSATQYDGLTIAHRNSLRLLKLVNTLLDFSRIEAGRIQASYQPTDIASFTAELASTFRSLIERAGMALVVDCSPQPITAYVDREMWEKIVLNLLSNAFKYTLEGRITIQIRQAETQINLTVIDTGIGIPASDLPHLFERFHRVKEAQGRSFEGSGIGLSLVQELVKLHGGSVSVCSTLGQGSCFTVSIPIGCAHLPSDRIQSRTAESPESAPVDYRSPPPSVTTFVSEAWRWLPDEVSVSAPHELENSRLTPHSLTTAPPPRPTILLADDNSDMRDYVKRLLAERYTVKAVPDGVAALQSIQQQCPDLVLTDVMMPRLDGFGLLQELRSQPETRDLPIILLSARAGEESRIEGLAAGADDYLIKPFSSRELLTRIEACLKLAQIRREAAQREYQLRIVAEQAQQAAEETAAYITEILESMADGFIALDADWRITYQNRASEDMTDKARQDILGQDHWQVWPAAVGTNLETQYRWAMAERVPVHFENNYVESPEFDRWFEVDVYPSPGGGLNIFFRDISDRKRTELALAEQKELLQLFVQYVPCGVAMFDNEMHYLTASQRWIQDYNLSSLEAIIGQSHYDFFPEIPERWQQIHQRCLAGAIERCEADRFERLDGSVQWIRWEVLPWYQLNQEIGGIIMFAEDITEQRQAESNLQTSQQQLQQQLAEIEAIYQSAPIGLNILDSELRFVRINQRLAEINGLPVEAHIGRTIRELLPDLADEAERILLPILATGEPRLNVEISGEIPAQPGVQRTWLESFWPLKEEGRVIGISTVCEEITERKRVEAERLQAEEDLRQAKEDLESRVAERTAELQHINRELQQREEQLRLTLEFNHIGSWDWDVRTGEVIWNDNHFRLLGLELQSSSVSDDELYQLWRNAIHPDDVERVEKTLLDALHQHQDYETEYRVIYPDHSIHWLVGKGRGIYDAEGEPIRMLGVVINISDRKQAEQILELQAVITRNMAEGICLVSAENANIVYANPKFEQMFGYEAGELNGKHVSIVNYATEEVSAEDINQAIRSAVLAQGEATYEIHNVKKDGTPFWCSATTSVMEHPTYGSVLVAVQQDISDRKQAQELIEASLKEKEVLLKEIHHRVKNNLGIVSSLLQMQARRITDAQINMVLRDSQNRIASIALVHEKLYRSEDLANINFTQYIQDLTVYLFDSYNISSQHIELNTQVENIGLDIDTAIPCGLIINELVSNALKYAFPDEKPGKIQVRFEQSEPIDQLAMDRCSRVFTLIVQDNGAGLPADLDLQQSRTLGMSLVKGLVKQIKGTIEISSQPGQGTAFTISFTKAGAQND